MPLPAASWLLGVTVLAALLLRGRLGDELFLTRYTGYVMPWLLVPLVPGAALAWLSHRALLGVVLSAAAGIVVANEAPLFRARAVLPPPDAAAGAPLPAVRGEGWGRGAQRGSLVAPTLRVMSFNTWSRNADAPRIARVVLRHRPDVLLLQEIRPEVVAAVAGELRRHGLYDGAPVHVACEPALLQAVLSRHPVVASAGLEAKGNAQRVVLRTPEGPLTVYNVHPVRTGGWRLRYSQIASLLEDEVLREAGPVILGGDFNAPDHSQLYRLVSGELQNAHAAVGAGLGFTYPAALGWRRGVLPAMPLVRIDHLFVSRHFATLRAGTLADSGGSDHRPVLAELALTATSRAPSASSGRP